MKNIFTACPCCAVSILRDREGEVYISDDDSTKVNKPFEKVGNDTFICLECGSEIQLNGEKFNIVKEATKQNSFIAAEKDEFAIKAKRAMDNASSLESFSQKSDGELTFEYSDGTKKSMSILDIQQLMAIQELVLDTKDGLKFLNALASAANEQTSNQPCKSF